MCILDIDKNHHHWREDPNMSLNDNLFFASVHYVAVFFGKYKINRHNNEHDFDDMAADCSIAVYEAAKRNLDKWDREKYRMDQYMYGRAWSVVGGWLQKYFRRKQRELLDVKLGHRNRLRAPEFDVGTDEIESSNYEQGTRYTVWKSAPLAYYEKKLSSAAQEYLDYRDECIDMGIEPVDPEDWLTNKNSKETDLRYLTKILNEKNPDPRVPKRKFGFPLEKSNTHPKTANFGL